MRSALIISGVVLLAVALAGVGAMSAQEQAKRDERPDTEAAVFEKEAAGKILVIFRGSSDPGGNTVGIEHAKLRTIAGRRFLSGTYAGTVGSGEDVLKGSPVHVAWDSLSEYLVLTPEGYRKWLEAYSDVSTKTVGH